MKRLAFLATAAIFLTACETAYYSGWEKLGKEKRDLLVDRIEDTQESQEDAQEEFADALEQFRSVVEFDGGDLEKMYNRLNSEYEDSAEAAEEISDNIDRVEDVADDLFTEWEREIQQYSSSNLRRDSEQKLKQTKRQYAGLLKSMRSAEKTIDPVLSTLKDQVLYLKHNLNARAISALKGELQTVNTDVERLIDAMEKSIQESNAFIAGMKDA
ncbi:MAG: DUF2959 domain-containing protein [Pseudomonadota bacterium]